MPKLTLKGNVIGQNSKSLGRISSASAGMANHVAMRAKNKWIGKTSLNLKL